VNERNHATTSGGKIMRELKLFVSRRYRVIFSKNIYAKIIFIFPQSFQVDANSPNNATVRKTGVCFPAKHGHGEL